ncbi:probable inner membrane protein YecN [Coccomyxa sp. Obi]|nr:probable inner membrane protein YecN [Coccomyxa sp. Obi]
MALPVTSFYGSLTGILYLALTFGVIRKRRELKVPYGDGGQRMLIKRIAAHTNASQYIPLALILLGLTEAGGFAHLAWLHFLGLLLLIGRCLHAYAIALDGTPHQYRVYGMVLTLNGLLLLCCTLLGHGIGLY